MNMIMKIGIVFILPLIMLVRITFISNVINIIYIGIGSFIKSGVTFEFYVATLLMFVLGLIILSIGKVIEKSGD